MPGPSAPSPAGHGGQAEQRPHGGPDPADRGASTRRPAVAGLFYPADATQCAMAAGQLLAASDVSRARDRVWRGGIVPHAGWICSGAIAGETLSAINQSRHAAGARAPDLVVVFGAVHTPLPLEIAALASHDAWQVPSGVSSVPAEVSAKLRSDASQFFSVDDRFHEQEHAVEVELPLIQKLWPGAAVLPVEVPLVEQAVEIGKRTARQIESVGLDAIYLASSDLTHYGPAYQFAPAGVGLHGLAWAKDNDRRLLDLVRAIVTGISPERIVTEVRGRLSACGGGAIAAMLAACRERGIVEARVLRHANSYETLMAVAPQRPDNAVGYAAVVIG